MYNDITTEERIDNYLLGRMSDEERQVFEADLEKDVDLKEEYECQKEIANAVQRIAMREFLNQLAAKQKPEGVIPFGTIWDFFQSKQGVWTLVSVAAAVVIVVVGCLGYSSASRTMLASGDYIFAEANAYISRGGDEIGEHLESAYSLIGENELKTALTTIEEAQRMIATEMPAEFVTEEDEYIGQILQREAYELDWYKAIVLMKQGKVFKARKALKAIATSDSPYAKTATEELKKPFDRKRKAQ